MHHFYQVRSYFYNPTLKLEIFERANLGSPVNKPEKPENGEMRAKNIIASAQNGVTRAQCTL